MLRISKGMQGGERALPSQGCSATQGHSGSPLPCLAGKWDHLGDTHVPRDGEKWPQPLGSPGLGEGGPVAQHTSPSPTA